MRNPKTQRGMTFISTMILLIVAGFFVMLLMKLGPIYLENYTIKNVVKDLVNDPMLAGRPMREIRDKLDRRLYINEVRRLERDDIQFKREGDKLNVVIEYQVKEHILANVDVLVSFRETGVMPTAGN